MANVRVRWIDSLSAAATGTKVYRNDVEIADIANGVQEYIDTAAPDDATPKYEVQAHDGAGDETTQEVEGENMDYIDTSPSAPTLYYVGFTGDAAAMAGQSLRTMLTAAKQTMPETGTLVNVSAFNVDNGVNLGNDLIVGVYADNGVADPGDAPGALLATSVEVSGLLEGWNTLDLVVPVEITAGTEFWLAISSQGLEIKWDAGVGRRIGSNTAGMQSPLPDPFDDPGSAATYVYAINAQYHL